MNERVARGQGYHEAWCAVNRTNPELWLANDGGGETANEGTSDGALAGWETRKMGDKAAAKTQEHYGAAKAWETRKANGQAFKSQSTSPDAMNFEAREASRAAGKRSLGAERRETNPASQKALTAHLKAGDLHSQAAEAYEKLSAEQAAESEKYKPIHQGLSEQMRRSSDQTKGIAETHRKFAQHHYGMAGDHALEMTNEGQPCGASHIAAGQTCHVGQGLPKLGAGEKGTGDMFKSQDQPFNLAGGQTTDGDRVAREAAKAEIDRAEAARIEKERQGRHQTGREYGIGCSGL